MTLEELLAAYEAAKAKSDAAPTDEALKAAADAALAAYDTAKAEAEAGGDEDPDESTLDAKTKAYIAKLRKENAGHRTKAKDLKSKLGAEEERRRAILRAAGITEDDEPIEEKFKKSSAQTEQLTFRNAILESAVRQGISGDEVDFFEFLVSKSVSSLEDGEELSDEQMAEIVKKVKKQGKGAANTSAGTGGGKGAAAPSPDGKTAVNLDQFTRMTISEKSKLYVDNPGLYNTLVTEAKQKKKLV